jgi:hypothetical protein
MKVKYELLQQYGNGKLDVKMSIPEFMKLFNITPDEWQAGE